MIHKTATGFDMAGDLPKEVRMLKHKISGHARILKMYDYTLESNARTGQENLLMLYEYCRGGDLAQFHPSIISEEFLWHVFTQATEGLAFLHYGFIQGAPDETWPSSRWQHVVHRDLKPDNIFLREKITPQNPFPDVVLGDFGLATFSPTSGRAGAIDFMPPEEYSSAKGDVWSLGATIHAMANGKAPIDPMPRSWLYGIEEWKMSEVARRPVPLPRSYSSALNRNMMRCLELDPRLRANSLDLLRRLVKDQGR